MYQTDFKLYSFRTLYLDYLLVHGHNFYSLTDDVSPRVLTARKPNTDGRVYLLVMVFAFAPALKKLHADRTVNPIKLIVS